MPLPSNFVGEDFRTLQLNRIRSLHMTKTFRYLPNYDIPSKVIDALFSLWCSKIVEDEEVREDPDEDMDYLSLLAMNRAEYYMSDFYPKMCRMIALFERPYRKVVEHMFNIFRHKHGPFVLIRPIQSIQKTIDCINFDKEEYEIHISQ